MKVTVKPGTRPGVDRSTTKARRGQAVDAAAMARHADAAAGLLKALAHPARLRVLCRLVEGEASVGALQPLVGLSLSALSQHLAVLRGIGLVTTRRESQTIHYALAPGPAVGVLGALHDAYCRSAHARPARKPARAGSRR
jgi:DNA-binding transcriptional ArsR family regulator